MKGKVYLVGAGPGQPDLITVRGLYILKEADVVIYDYLVDKRILGNAKEDAKLICCDRLGKKRYSNSFSAHQDKINNLLVRKAKEGKKVIRLKNGDPTIFSRCSQELEALAKNNIEFELVPGITAAVAASSFCGIPLTDRRFASSCAFVTGHEDPTKKESLIDWKTLSRIGTLIIYMGVESLESIVSGLFKAGKDKNTVVAIVQEVSLPTQRLITGTLKDIAAKARREKIRPPAVIIIGETVRLEKRFNWLRKTERILFTGLSRERFFIKGNFFHLPLIEIEPLTDYGEFDGYLKHIRDFDWIVFASRYGVEYFFKRLNTMGNDSRILADIKIAAVGKSTAGRLLDFGIIAELVPEKESAEGLTEEFKKINIKDKKIFLPRSDIADKGLENALKGLGAKVSNSFAYRNVAPKDLPALNLNYFNEIIFTSPSGVRNFKRRYKEVPKGVKIKCIGEVTLREAKRCDLLG